MTDGAIAVVGASCRIPGADNLEDYWQLLASGGDAVTEVDDKRWSTRFYYHPKRSEPGKSYTWSAGLIAGVDLFEPSFFGISPREAAQMDPQQRLLLELVWHAFEDAGIPPSKVSGDAAGVYIGASATDYSDLRLGDPAGADSYFMTGSTLSILANRISYVFDLHGPSLAVDTACSSSLVALHHACEAIRGGSISTAIVGGVNLLLAPYPFIGFSRASMLSQRGHCFAFDERADGYVRGEGGGVVLLKRLDEALADNNPIRAVILATGVNSDGRTIGLSLPSETAQAALLRSVHRRAGVSPDQVAFFEMHGTGTAAGDPIEAAAVGHALGQARSSPLPIGSVKANIGHLEPASGMAGLLKAALALDRGLVPPTIHCETPNPKIPFDELNLRLVREPEQISDPPAYAGVNSFGFGGTNAHVVLAAPPRGEETATPAPMPPLVISARTEASLRGLVQSWAVALAEAPAERLPMMLRAAARGRDPHRERLVALTHDPAATAGLLTQYVNGEPSPSIVTGTAVREGKLAFVFSGNGAQFTGMGRAAWHASAAFRAAVEEVDCALLPELGWSVTELLDNVPDGEAMARADIAQPLLFAVQVGIVRALEDAGVVAAGHFGHSVGEIAAAWAAGALSLAEAGRVVVARSRCQQRTQGHGRMAALALAPDAAGDFLAGFGSEAEIAAINAAHSVTVSGSGAEIERLEAEAKRRGLWFRRLDLDFAFHSRAMDPIREALLASLAGLRSDQPITRLVSTVTGDVVEERSLGAEYWWRNIRSPVRFTEAAARLIAEEYRIFLEVGPAPILQSYLNDALREAATEGRVLPTLTRKQTDHDPFPMIAAHCHVAGYDLTASQRFDGKADPRGVPLYPWARQRFWFDSTVEAADPTNPPFEHPLLGFRQHSPVPCWLNHLDDQLLPWIGDHAVEGMPVFPAAAILEMAAASARWRTPDAPVLEVHDLEVRRPLPFDKGRTREVRVVIGSEEGDWELASRLRLSTEPLTVHASGRIGSATNALAVISWSKTGPVQQEIDREALYKLAHLTGLDYGSRFRTVSRIDLIGADEATAVLDPSPLEGDFDNYLLHPALLDGALQALLGLIANRRQDIQSASFLPWRFGRVRFLAPFGRLAGSTRVRLTRIGTRSASADIAVFDDSGTLVAELADCWFRRVELTHRASPDQRALRVDLVPVSIAELPGPAVLNEFGPLLSRLVAAIEPDPARQEQGLLLEALIGAVALRSIEEIVGQLNRFAVAELAHTGAIAPGGINLAEGTLRLLERFGVASAVGMEWRLENSGELPDVEEVWRLLLAEAPDLVTELALTASALDSLPKALAGRAKPAEPSLNSMIDHLAQGSPAAAAGVGLLCDALGQIASQWPAGRSLRILELGAISGEATRRVLDALAQSNVALSYLATSADPEQAARLSYLTESATGVSARHWSPRDAQKSLDGARFDIILAVNACARLQLDAMGFSALRDLLAPGGVFVAVEPEPNALWDLVFGQNFEWWLAGAPAAEASPLRSGEEWRGELAAAGFQSAQAIPSVSMAWPWTVFWGRAPAGEPALSLRPARPAFVSLIADESAFVAALRDTLPGGGHRVAYLDPSYFAGSDGHDLPEPEGGSPEIVLFVAEEAGAGDGVEDASRQIATLARVAAKAALRKSALWVVTCDAQQASPAHELIGSAGAALWGLARVLVNELPGLSVRLVDLAGSVPAAERARQIAAEVAADGGSDEVVWTPHGRHVLRVRRGLPWCWAEETDLLTLGSRHPGGLDSLGWERGVDQSVGPGQVEIEVHAAGLNFRDMMWAMGLLPEEALIDGFAGATFGLECAGVVRAVGPGVESVAIGDRVMGFAPAALSTRAVTMADAVTPIPPAMSFAEAATIPVTFVTAIYALGHLAKLGPGEHVLIHAAAGGVGLAAIQYAKHRGAVVIATAGTQVKRSFLRLAGADYVLDSRDLTFADAVREITGGRGVDVVLNSLSGEAMERSLEVLKPFGRFLELGKRDLYLNRRVHLRPLRQNISYYAIDIDQLPVRRPDVARELLAEISAALAEGAIRPLAHRVFSYAELDDAFRLMQPSWHIGKLVLVPRRNAGVRLRQPPAFEARRDGTYLVTGGLEGFGYEAARWLVARGAGSIALVGRRGAETPGCEARVRELEAAGAEVRIYRCDVADHASLAAILDAIRAAQPPLRGLVHAASSVADGLASDIELARLRPVLRSKIGGAIALDALTRDDPIELFLLFSSATTLVGAPAQGVYVAANMALEALARRRRAEGRPALAIAWGPIEDAGYLADRPETRDALARRLGAKPLPAADALAGLPAMLAGGLPVASFAETNWNEARRFLPILATPLFSEIRTKTSASPSDESLHDRLASLDPEAALALLKTVVAEEASTILRLPAGGIDPVRPLSEMGMDSLMAVELRLALEGRLRIDLPLVSLAEGTSVASIAARLAAALSTVPADGELIALVARHEGVEPSPFPAEAENAGSAVLDTKPVAAE